MQLTRTKGHIMDFFASEEKNGASRHTKPNITRRGWLELLLGAGAIASFAVRHPNLALAVDRTDLDAAEDALSDAEDRLDEVEAQIEALAEEYEALSATHADTLQDIEDKQAEIEAKQDEIDEKESQIEAKQDEIDQKQADIEAKQDDIEAKQAELEEDQEVLSKRISSAYKTGNADFLSILFASSSFEELTSNIYYLGKINQSDKELIESVKTAKEELEAEKAELEQQKADLEAAKEELEAQKADLEAAQDELEAQKADLEVLSSQQQSELDQMEAKQDEVNQLLEDLDDEVRELMAERDEELLAYQQAQAAEQAASYSANDYDNAATVYTNGGTGSLSDVLASAYNTPSPGAGYCAAWITNVFRNAGVGTWYGNANNMYSSWCGSSDRSQLQAGMIIACSTHPNTVAGRIYGHIGIYMGGGIVRDNIGYIRTISVDEWISYYSATVPVRWGWFGGVVLS